MDIAGLSVALSQNTVLTKVGTAVLDKALDTNEVLGQNLVSMIDAAALERSVNPHIGSNFDMLV
ncbi:MAG: YjfB family protein [Lachnospiraceae bacterium]|nr:YjfB family protein [Lachnospiraceae bacterium]